MSINRSSSAPQPVTEPDQMTNLNKNGNPSTPKNEATTRPAMTQIQNPSSSEIQTATSNNSRNTTVENQPTIDPSIIQTTSLDTDKHSSMLLNDPHQKRVNLIAQALDFVKSAFPKLEKHKEHINIEHKEASEMFKELRFDTESKELKDLMKIATKLKLQIPVKQMTYDESNEEKKHRDISSKLLEKMPKFHDKLFHGSPFFKTIQQRYHILGFESKLCLLCFSVFPENAIISRRLMVYWWIGEGFVPLVNVDAETTANNLFNELIDMDFIEPVSKRHGSNVAVCKMNPMVRAVLVKIADKVKFFDIDKYGNPKDFGKFDEIETRKDMKDIDPFGDEREYFILPDEIHQDTSGSHGCIDSKKEPEDKWYEKKKSIENSHKLCLMGSGLSKAITWEKVYTLFNVKDDVLDFKPEWFLKMKYVNVVFLGRWQTSAAHHIEGEEFKFEESLKHMKSVRLFSLQGVSGISQLPKSISNLKNLLILDLRSCYNLHVIPKTIGSLKHLTHLDMSECYLLEHMPKEISSLESLQVLKGFVVIEDPAKHTCTLHDLKELKTLRKLSMYTRMKKFPEEQHLVALQNIESLRKLTILWGGHESKRPLTRKQPLTRQNAFRSVAREQPLTRKQPLTIEKLDLKGYPYSDTPDWLTPRYLQELKKLYIRGGKFSDIGQYQDIFVWDEDVEIPRKEKWNVEVLRLKYLEELKIEWSELQDLFPKMTSLEKVKCPQLTLFPCNEHGVWIK